MVLTKYSTEEEIASVVIEFLLQDNWEIYQEVRFDQGGPRADIVGVRKGIVHFVEVKRTLSFKLLSQAANWRHEGHYSSVAIPRTKGETKAYTRDRGREMAYNCFKNYGVGILILDKYGGCEFVVNPVLERKNHSWVKRRVLDHLHPDLKNYGVAGSKKHFWTPFRQTVDNLEEIVQKTPGISFQDAIDILCHSWHYASVQSGRSSLGSFLDTKVISGIRTERVKGRIMLYPVEKTEPGIMRDDCHR